MMAPMSRAGRVVAGSLTLLVGLLVWAAPAGAVPCTWDSGGADDNVSTAGNWVDDVSCPGADPNTNDFVINSTSDAISSGSNGRPRSTETVKRTREPSTPTMLLAPPATTNVPVPWYSGSVCIDIVWSAARPFRRAIDAANVCAERREDPDPSIGRRLARAADRARCTTGGAPGSVVVVG